jgi:hypothetical protein
MLGREVRRVRWVDSTRETVESWLHPAIGTCTASLTMHGHRRSGTARSARTPNEVREMGSIRGGSVTMKDVTLGARQFWITLVVLDGFGRFEEQCACVLYVVHVW